jgi:prepilin-type N-terminal cleavage/methylation domain-containing protein
MAVKNNNSGDSGFTLVELMVAAAVSSIGLVVLMGSVLAVDNHQTISDYEAIGTNFTSNVLEFVQDQDFTDFEDLATYNPGITDAEGNVNVPGFGTASFTMFAIIPNGVGTPISFEIGVDDPANIVIPPNPVEVRAVINAGGYGESTYSYSTSTMISF